VKVSFEVPNTRRDIRKERKYKKNDIGNKARVLIEQDFVLSIYLSFDSCFCKVNVTNDKSGKPDI